jgi:RNA polymerase-binding transcription factor DksA
MIDTTHFKEKLLQMKADLEADLSTTGQKDNVHEGDWHPAPSDQNPADFRDDIADKLEDLQEQEATEANLEKSLRAVTSALEKMESGLYGKCNVCGGDIEIERLEANPAAETCKAHLPSEE